MANEVAIGPKKGNRSPKGSLFLIFGLSKKVN